MDSDEFDEDFGDEIADEDLLVAATQAVESVDGALRTAATGNVRLSNAAPVIDLDDIPSDAFSSPPVTRAVLLPSREAYQAPKLSGQPQLRQTTLFGTTALRDETQEPAQRLNSNRVFRADLPSEAPTHHEVNRVAMETWVYPTNLGPTRDYQFSIVKNGLFNNTLVALPTGLGKTFIAATVMLNFYRWTKTAKIVFVAPTKPLVSQQVDACFNIAGIPRSQTTLLTGEVAPALRAEEWETKRVFFMTPQTLENDLSSGIADPKSICLLVVDEAHRATGNYAYSKVVAFIRRFSKSFRILALTATPGSTVEAVQDVIDNLGISSVEIRTEESLDIRQYVHHRDEDIVLLDPSEEITKVKDLFSKALKPLVDKLSQQNIYYGRDPMSLTTFGLIKLRKDWAARSGLKANQGLKFVMMAVFNVLTSLAHSIKLLSFHGIKPFYENLCQFRDQVEDKGEKGSKFKRQVTDSQHFQEMMKMIGQWARKDDFVSHPKLTYLCDTVLNHFLDAGDGHDRGASSNTRIIVFSEYRDSAEEIVRVLNRHKPMIRAAVFVGQAATAKSEGMKQSEQIERIDKFKKGEFNVLVATSIGEEGLDIGQVDLIICYDASGSPIRMLQRMGRTGRKRAGKVVLLLMRGKEEENYNKAKDGYEKMQQMICEGSRFAFRHDLSTRIVPRDIKPEVDKRLVDIPVENSQDHSLPEPKRGRPRKKKPPKKFHMPDDVETGFMSVGSMLGKRSSSTKIRAATPEPTEEDDLAAIPSLDCVQLSRRQKEDLRLNYKHLPYFHADFQKIGDLDLTANPVAQRALQKTVHVKHGERTKRCVKLFRTLSQSQSVPDRFFKPYGDEDQSRYDQLWLPDAVSESDAKTHPAVGPPFKKRRVASTDEDAESGLPANPRRRVAAPGPRKPRKKPGAKRRSSDRTQVELDSVTVDDENEVDASDLPNPPRRPGKRASAKRPPTAERGRPKRKQKSGVYDESDDQGDDCGRTSDLELSDDSDEGSDLVDFIVGDDVQTSSLYPTSSAQLLTSQATYSTPTAATTMDLDVGEDEMPSVSQMAEQQQRGSRNDKSRRKALSSEFILDSEDEEADEEGEEVDDEEESLPVRTGRRPRRTVLSDDDDEDDDDDDD